MDISIQTQKKLKQLQSHVPFLAELIKKLEALPSNSRGAQLTKIKQLYGLLTGSAHKLKLETLIKCESVILKLQGKLTTVTLPKSDLEKSLAKLKSANKIENSLSNRLEKSSAKNTLKNDLDMKTLERSTLINDYKDHDYRPHEELQGNLYQRRIYRNDIKKEYSKPSSHTNTMEDVLKKPPLSADDISNLLHETTDDDEENLDSKDISELYKIQNSLVDKMKKETDHGLVDNEYTGHNRLAFKYPRKKIETLLSPVGSETDSESADHSTSFLQNKQSAQSKPLSIYANITTLAPLPQYNLDNSYMKQEWFPMQTQANTPPIRNMSSMYGNDSNLSLVQSQSNVPSVYANDPRLRHKLQQQTKQQLGSPQSQIPSLLSNTNNYYPWYQNNVGQHNQMQPHQQSSYYMQQQQHQHQQHQQQQQHHHHHQHQQQQQFNQQQMMWGSTASSSTMYNDNKLHQNFNNPYNNRFGNNDRQMGGSVCDESYKKFRPTLNDMVERKFYEKSKKTQHNQSNIPINILEAPKFEAHTFKTTIVHDITADDWIVNEMEKEKELPSNSKEGQTKPINQPPKDKILESKAREINGTKDQKTAGDDNDVIVLDKDPPQASGSIKEKSDVANETSATGTKPNEATKQEEKITKEWIEKVIINLFNPNKSTDDSSSTNLGLLSKVLDQNKLNRIKSILRNDDTASVEETVNRSNNSDETSSSKKTNSSTLSVSGEEEKEMPEKDNTSENNDKEQEPKKLRTTRKNELDKLNLDIMNMFIREDVLTSTGRRMCTILKDNAYAELSEKDKRNTVQNNANKKGETDEPKLTRKNALKNCSVILPKINLNKQQNENEKSKNKLGSKTQNSIPTKSISLRQKRRKRNRGKQWASGVINKKQTKRKQNNDEYDADKQTDEDDDDDDEIEAVNNRTYDDDDGDKTEVEDNLPDDRSSISDLSELSVVPAAGTREIIKNVDKNYYFNNKRIKKCILCLKACPMRLMPKHFVSKHKQSEVYISRLSPLVADIFLNNLEQRSGTRTFHKLKPVIKFSCYFCDSLCFLSVEDWISHIATHTGEYLRSCTKCPWQSSFSYFHQCTKKGVAYVVKEFKFDGNQFHGYLCSGCNYVQLQEENIVKHIKNEHDPSEKDVKTLKVNLINVPPIKIIKRGRKKLSPTETDIPESMAEISAPIEEPKVLRSSKKSVLIVEPKIEPTEILPSPDVETDKNFHAKEKEIIGEMEMRKNSSSSIVDRLKARFKENVTETSNKEQNKNQSLENNCLEAPNVSKNVKAVDNLVTEDTQAKNLAAEEADNKSNDSEWEDLDDANSCDSTTSFSKLQAEIETSNKPGSLTNTLVRLLDKIKSNPEKRKLSPSQERDESKVKKNRIDFRELLKQTKTTEPETETTSPNTPLPTEIETNETADGNQTIKIKEEFDETLQIKSEPLCLENEQDEDAVLFRIDRMGYKIKQNTFPQVYTFLCLFENCQFTTTNSTEFTNHITAKSNEFWEGFCYICESYVRADDNMPLDLEIKHMLEVHLKMNISINVEQSVKVPLLSLKKLPGDLLSSSIYNRMSLAPSENISEMLLIKPWTRYQNYKTHVNCEEMLKEINLSNLYKCMGMHCNFSTSAVIDYLDHLKNHEKNAEDQLVVNPCNLDTSSWLECPYCEIFADTYYDLVQHVTEKHKNSFYQCGYCFYRSFLATNVVMHRNKHHNDLPLSVLLCGKMENLPKINFEKILTSRTSNIRPLLCSMESCKNKKFYALDLFLNHQTKHNQTRYLCEFCSLSVDSKTILSHLVTHGIGLFECIYCRFATNKIKKIQIHMCDKHPTKLLFITLRIFRHLETNSVTHDLAGDISSIYLVNFGQRLTINFTEIHSTIVNNKSLDLLENDRPKIFPSGFDGGCLLNIAECNKLIAGSSVQILEINSAGSTIPIKPAFGSSSKDHSGTDDNSIETPDVLQIKNTPTILKNKTGTPENNIINLSMMSKNTAMSSGTTTQNLPLSLVTKTTAPSSTSTTVVVPLSLASKPLIIPTTASPITITASSIATTASSIATTASSIATTASSIAKPTKEICKLSVATKFFVTAPQEKVIISNMATPDPTSTVPKPTSGGGKEICEDRLEEIAKKISVEAISPKNTKFQCLIPRCNAVKHSFYALNLHLLDHSGKHKPFTCYFCNKENANAQTLVVHLSLVHTYRFFCYYCSFKSPLYKLTLNHLNIMHNIQAVISKPITKTSGNGSQEIFVITPRNISDENFNQYKYELIETHNRENRIKQNLVDPEDVNSLPREAIFLNELFCSICRYGTKVRTNLERHLKFHLNEVPVPKIDPINPVPCLSTTERHFDKMKNLACSSQEDRDRLKIVENSPKYVTETQRFTCGAQNCQYLSINETMLNCHLKTLHYSETSFKCVHCKPVQNFNCHDNYINHLRLHDKRLFKCNTCDYFNTQRQYIEKHLREMHKSNVLPVVVIREDDTASSSGATSVTPNNSETSNLSVINSNNNSLNWVCNSCSFVSTTKKQMIDHNSHTHSNKSQFVCKACGYRSNVKLNVENHLVKKHPDLGENQIFTTYSRSDEPESNFVDNSPLWSRDSNRVKSIRGILFEDEEMAANTDSNSRSVLSGEEDESEESSEDDQIGMFCCNYCNYMAAYRCVKMHHKEKHKDREFKIKRTNLTTTTAPDVPEPNDEKTKSASTIYLCVYCPLRHRSIKHILLHWKDKHQRPKVKSNNTNARPLPFQFRITRLVRCYYCHEKYGYHELARHVAKYHVNFPIVAKHYLYPKRCGECDFKCEFSETDLVSHSKSEHADSKCRTIPSELLSENLLNRYMNMEVEQFYICTGCNLESYSKPELEQHLRQLHNNDPLVKMEIKANKLLYCCSSCKFNSNDEFTTMKHIMKFHSQSCEKSSTKIFFYNAMQFKNNIDKFDQIKLIFPNGLLLNKADVVNTAYGGYDHIVKRLSDFEDMPSPLSKKRNYDGDVGSNEKGVSRLQPDNIKRLKLSEHKDDNVKHIESYDLRKIYTSMQIGGKSVRVSCDKFAALFNINPVLKLNRI